MTESFTAQLSAWAKKTQRRQQAILRASASDVIDLAQTPIAKGGNMPVDTGFLRNSLQSSLSGSTSLTGPDSYALVAGQMEPGDVARFGWTASYAGSVEYGTRGRPGRYFVRNAARQWPHIVKANVAKAKAAIG
jgi:hypothetical protein